MKMKLLSREVKPDGEILDIYKPLGWFDKLRLKLNLKVQDVIDTEKKIKN